jgi:hypothetical protein
MRRHWNGTRFGPGCYEGIFLPPPLPLELIILILQAGSSHIFVIASDDRTEFKSTLLAASSEDEQNAWFEALVSRGCIGKTKPASTTATA